MSEEAISEWGPDGPAVLILLEGGTGVLITNGTWNDEGTPVVPDVWHLVEFHYVDDGTGDVYVDGVLVSSPGSLTGEHTLWFGQTVQNAYPGSPNSNVYVRDVKIGTTRGGTELFQDDFSSGNFSAWTSTTGDVSIIDDPFVVPGTPTLDSAVFTAPSVLLSWTDAAGPVATGHRIYRGLSSGGEHLLDTVGAVTEYEDSDLQGNRTYFYKVSAFNSTGESALSNELSVALGFILEPSVPESFVLTPVSPVVL